MSTPYSGSRLLAPFDSSSKEVDWRDRYVVRPVRDQGSCGSCWAFASTASAESSSAITTGVLTELSEQYLVSCDTYDSGCGGGLGNNALRYLHENGCIKRADYPYTSGSSGSSGSCQASGLNTHSLLVQPGYEQVGANYADFKAALMS